MGNVLRGSLLWRLVQYLLTAWRCSALHRFGAGVGRVFRQSGTKKLFVRFLSAPAAATDNARLTAWSSRWNGRLWRLGQRLLPLLRGSLLYCACGAVFRCGRNSRILGWLFRGGLTAFLLVVLGFYGIVDYGLRDVLSVPAISSIWDEALMLLTAGWILCDRMRAPQPLAARTTPLDPAVLLFFAVGLSLMFVVSPFFSIAVDGYRATVQYMLWFLLLTRLLRGDRDLMMLYRALIAAAALIALHGIYQYIVAAPIPSHWVDEAEGAVRTRVYSIFGSPNIMASYMVMFAPMTAGLAYWAKDRKKQVFWWLLTFCMCFSCLFTMSRGGWVAMAAAILIFALLVDRRLLGLMLVALIVAMFLPFVASRIGYLLTPEFQNAHNHGGRGSRWPLALGYFRRNPAFGFGLGMFGGAVAMQNQVYHWVSYFYVDNYYLKILVEMGVIGFSAFILLLLVLLAVSFRALYRTARAPRPAGRPSYYPLCAGMISGLCGVLIHCYFENVFEEPYMMAYFWTVAAMIVYLGFLRPKEAPAADPD